MRLWHLAALLSLASCAPLRTSMHNEHHQWELTVHEVRTQLEDLRHDINCFQAEMQILEGRIKYFETALAQLKHQEVEKHQASLEDLAREVQELQTRSFTLEAAKEGRKEEVQQLSLHAQEVQIALAQCKQKIEELEKTILAQNRRLESMSNIKSNVEILAKSLKTSSTLYRVRAGDSLEKIAKLHKTSIQAIQSLNHLQSDRIVVGQELQIPSS